MKSRAILLTSLLLGIFLGLTTYRHTRVPQQSIAATKPSPVSVSAERRNYPYSLVPFGVQSAEELKQAMLRDAGLAEHYRGFDFSNATFVVLDHDDCGYVSFRKAGEISWTRKCVKLYRGEKILTDAHYLVRAACGNQIAYRPQAPTAPVDVAVLGPDAPPVTPGGATPNRLVAAVTPPAVGGGTAPAPASPVSPVTPSAPVAPAAPGSPTVPVLIPPYGGGTCCRPPVHRQPTGPSSPPVGVPESDYAGMLILSGILIVAALYAKHR